MTRKDPFVAHPGRPEDCPPVSGTLSGQRLAVKDLFQVAGHVRGAGNPDWQVSESAAKETAPCVAQLLNAGAELVGMTVTDELAYSLMGRNLHYGALANPRSPERVSGGSSSGSAVAVASGRADIGLGTDTGGSIRVPGSFCGLYGLRPTHGCVDMKGVLGLAPPYDTVGWMTRDLNTLAQVADLLLPDDEEPTPARTSLTLWWPAEWPDTLRLAIEQQLLAAGFQVDTDRLDESVRKRAAEAFRVLQGRAVHRLHGDWVARKKPVFADDVAARFATAASLTEDDEARARNELTELSDWLTHPGWTLLPTTAGAAPLQSGDAAAFDAARQGLLGLTAFAGLSGRPQIHLPWLTDQGAPWGLSLMGPRRSDRTLIQLADHLRTVLLDAGADGPLAPDVWLSATPTLKEDLA